MTNFFKNIINDSRSGIPSVAQQPGPSFAGATPEHDQMVGDSLVSESVATKSAVTSEENWSSTNIQQQKKENLSENVDNSGVFNLQKIQHNANRTTGEMTAPVTQHELQPFVPQQTIDATVRTDRDGRKPVLTDTQCNHQAEEGTGTKQSQPAVAQTVISDDLVADAKDSKHPKGDQKTIDSSLESVRKQKQSETHSAQHKTKHVPLDKSIIFTESELRLHDSQVESDSGSDVNPENAGQRQSFQSRSEEIIQNATAQESHYASKPPTVALNNEVRTVKPAVESHKEAYPQVRIGLVNVVVEGPKMTQRTQASKSNKRHDDQTSRHYLRSL